ncbi:MAG: glycosyltransferase family protein [Rhodospirillaceae bacterium]|nr:glycosyltransferase family protein [Rhodospirillaceae bacterium]
MTGPDNEIRRNEITGRDIIDGLLKDAEAALAAGATAKALAIYQGVLMHEPDHVLALRQAGAIMLHQNNAGAALQLFQHAVKLKPADADLYHGVGTALRQIGYVDEAILALKGAVQVDPAHKPALYDLGLLYKQKGDYAKAEQMLGKAAAQANAYGESRFEAELQRAVALFKQDRLPEAERWFHRAGLLNPDDPRPFVNVAVIYRIWGHFDAAEKWLRKAIEAAPDSAEAHWTLAHVLLVKGDLPGGFAEYEWRFRREGRAERAMPMPRWTGEDLNGKTLLLTAEQGLGDMIHFSRFAPDFAGRGARVIVECHPGLEVLLSTVPAVSGVITLGQTLPPADYYLPMMSSALALGISLETIPAPIPYVSAPKPMKPLAAAGFKVGLVWRGNAKHENDRFRSVDLGTLLPVLKVPGAVFYSLQIGGTDELRALPDVTVHDLSPALTDFSATASNIAQLDLVITVDTAVAHLAGALGRTAWVLLARGNDWRWLHGRSDTPWYPSLALFRQTPPRDWGVPVAEMARALTSRIAQAKR